MHSLFFAFSYPWRSAYGNSRPLWLYDLVRFHWQILYLLCSFGSLTSSSCLGCVYSRCHSCHSYPLGQWLVPPVPCFILHSSWLFMAPIYGGVGLWRSYGFSCVSVFQSVFFFLCSLINIQFASRSTLQCSFSAATPSLSLCCFQCLSSNVPDNKACLFLFCFLISGF